MGTPLIRVRRASWPVTGVAVAVGATVGVGVIGPGVAVAVGDGVGRTDEHWVPIGDPNMVQLWHSLEI